MIRIFTSLAIFSLLLLATTFILGLSFGDLHAADISEQTRQWATVHRLLGVMTALVVVLVNSIVVTYFIGTSRWCKEVAETYSLDANFVRRSTLLKRRTFPWALMSMLVIVGVVALGGAADPATLRQGTAAWVAPHLIGAMLGIIFVGFAYFIEGTRIAAHAELINEIVAEVRRMREERGLEV